MRRHDRAIAVCAFVLLLVFLATMQLVRAQPSSSPRTTTTTTSSSTSTSAPHPTLVTVTCTGHDGYQVHTGPKEASQLKCR